MVNKKLKVEKSSDVCRPVEQAFEQEEMFLSDYETYSEPEMCEKKKKFNHCEFAELDHDEQLVNSDLLREFNTQRHVSSQCNTTTEHFGVHRQAPAGQYAALVREFGRASPSQAALHQACKHVHDEMLAHLLRNGARVDGADPLGRDVWAAELLLERGADPRAKTHDGLAPLFFAVQAGCTLLVEMLIGQGCDVNELVVDRDLNRHYSYLHSAVERNHVPMVETLLHCNADVNQRDCYGSTSLHFASRHGRSDIARLLLAHGARVHDRDYNELTALYLAVEAGHKDLFHLLLQHGADLNDRGSSGTSLLHLTIKHGDLEFVGILLSMGANVDAATRFGKTPLHYAIAEKNWTALELLLEHGADLNRGEMLGKSPLHSAIESGRKEAFDILLRHRADVNARDNARQTPLHAAVKQGCLGTAQLLLERGADVDAEDEARRTPLHLAVKFGYVHLFELLVKFRANIDATDADGSTPLHLAVLAEHTKLFYLRPDFTFFACLLSSGADVYKRTISTGESALHLAVKKRCAEFAGRLLRRGAEVNVEERSGSRLPLHVAVENDDEECVECLLTFGADVGRLDEAGKTPLELTRSRAVARIFAVHFARRSTAGFHVEPRHAKMLEQEEGRECGERFRERCAEEVNRMMASRMYGDVTYFDFLRGTRRSLVAFARHQEVVAVFEQQLQRAAFPLYADMLEKNFDTGKRYEPVLDEATARLNAVCRYRLPGVPVEKVLSYLDARDMRNLVHAVPSLPIVFVKKEM